MLTTILSFLAVLGVLIFIHELGHYLAARHVGVRVEAFSIGFPPTALEKRIGETEYRKYGLVTNARSDRRRLR